MENRIIISEDERNKIIQLSAGQEMRYDYEDTFVSLFLEKAKANPLATAVVDDKGAYTYQELDSLSNALAKRILETVDTNKKKERPFISIMLSTQKEFLVAAIAVERAGMAYVPLDYDYPDDRLQYMLEDSESQMLITSHEVFEEKGFAKNMGDSLKTLFIDDFLAGVKTEENAESINLATPDALAYMIYTSGSTGKPKGVMIPHRAKANFMHFIRKEWRMTPKSRICCHSSFSFDASVEDLYAVLTAGGTLYVVPAEARKDLDLLYKFIVDNGITGGSYSTQIGQMLLQNYDLPVEYVAVGGEKMTANPDFKGRLINLYGPTEFTVDATYYELERGREYANIPIGRPLHNTSAFVVDKQGNLLPIGEEGELCLTGRQMAAGYWHRDDLTEKVFCKASFLNETSDDPYAEGYLNKVYHTGDLVRWNEDGQLEYMGRIDSQVKLRGFRIELGEIETLIAGYEGVNMTSVQVKEVGGVQHLVAYYSAKEEIDKEALRAYLAGRLTEYMVPTVYMQLDEMPLTPNGKVNTKVLPDPEIEGEEFVEPEGETETLVAAEVCKLLGTKQISATANLISHGMTSLSLMNLALQLTKATGKKVNVADIMQDPTVRGTAATLNAKKASGKTVEIDYSLREYYPITENQRGLIIDWEMNHESTQYNIPEVQIHHNVSSETLKQAVVKMVEAHPYLKTRFAVKDGDYVQVRRDNEPVEVSVQRVDKAPDGSFFKSRVRPFDLFNENLYRFEIYDTGDTSYLFYDIHHTIYDGVSSAYLLEYLYAALKGEELEKEEYTYFEHSLEEKAELDSEEAVKEAETYFDTLLSGTDATVYPHSTAPDDKNGSKLLRMASKEFNAGAIRKYCLDNGITPNNYFSTVLSILLHRVTREETVCFSTINNGRNDARKMNLMGMFVKTIPMVSTITNDSLTATTMKAEAAKTQQEMAGILAHDYYPFTKMVERYGLKFEILFDYQDLVNLLYEFDKESVGLNDALRLDNVMAPLTLIVADNGTDTCQCNIEYDASLYNNRDMQMLAEMYATLAVSLAKTEKIADAEMVGESEKQAIITLSEGQRQEYDYQDTFITMFLQHVKERPQHTAVVDSAGSYTYQELNSLSNALAKEILGIIDTEKKAEKPFISIMMGTEKEFLIATIAVERAGMAYVPLDHDYPDDRLQYMLEDSESQLLITTHKEFGEKGFAKNMGDSLKTLFIDDFLANIKTEENAEDINLATPDALAYMIYTSGSTGKPKGVMIPHRAKANLMHFIRKEWRMAPKSRICCHSSFSFDASIEDLYAVLTAGGTLYVVPAEARKDLDLLYKFIVDNGITGGSYTTQIGQMLLQNYDLPVEYVAVGGEKMTANPDFKGSLINLYGPTEFTVDSTYYELERGREYVNIPIGRPLHNLSAFVLDNCGRLLPQGIPGELCMAGRQMARGYWHRDDLTQKVFCNAPFLNETSDDPYANEYLNKVYHTGDLVRYNDEGQIEYLGRIDKQVKLRGFRIELGEIETLIAGYKGVDMVSVQVKEVGGVQHLVAYYSAKEEIDKEALRAYLAGRLTDYMVPTVYMQLDVMPLTPNGKVNTKALPEPQIEAEEFIEPQGEAEQTVANAVCKLLGVEKISATANLINHGMTSLSLMRLTMDISNTTGKTLKVADVMKAPIVRDIAKLLDGNDDKNANLNIDYTKREYYPITENQRGLIIDWEINRDTTQYNIPDMHIFKGVNGETLKEAVIKVVEAHPYLKTRFAMKDGDYMQVRRDDAPVEVTVTKVEKAPDTKFLQDKVRPFDLFNDNLYRFEIYDTGDASYLFLDIHHTVFDGMSNKVLLDEIDKALKGTELEKEKYTCFEHSLEEQALLNSEKAEEAQTYFDQLLAEAETTIYPHSTTPDNTNGTAQPKVLTKDIDAQGIQDFCKKNGITANNYFSTVLSILLHRITREETVCYTTINNGRDDLRKMSIMGMFVKTIPVVSTIEKEAMLKTTMREEAAKAQKQTAEILSRIFYPFTRMVERNKLKFEILFDYQDSKLIGEDSEEQEVSIELNMVKVPIDVTVTDTGASKYDCAIEYDMSLYNETDIRKFLDMYVTLAVNLAKTEKIADAEMVGESEKQEIMTLSSAKRMEYDYEDTFVSLFLKQVAARPLENAVADKDGAYTYKELNSLSNALAKEILGIIDTEKKAEKPFISIMMGTQKEFLIATIAVERARMAYVPLDHDYPDDRLQYMLEDSESQLLITTHKEFGEKGFAKNMGDSLKTLFIDDFLANVKAEENAENINLATPDALAYMIYTSGSTGKPKGVMIPNRAKANFVHFIREEWRLTEKSRICCHSSFSFDASIEDLYPVLTAGGTLYVVPAEARKDLDLLYKFIVDNGITGGCYTTQLGQMLLQNYDLPVEYLVVGGEKMTANPDFKGRLINTYGPTEFTVDATFFVTEKGKEYTNIPIGRPLYNLKAFVLDSCGQLLPQGIPGELCMAGRQMARGYWHREDLTQKVFCKAPFLNETSDDPYAEGYLNKVYHTGDLVRYNDEGQIEYMGRIDKQVKLRGFRIELGEIETLIAGYKGVDMTSVQVKEVGGVQHLVAYYSAKEEIDKEALRTYLAGRLTEYMVPTVYMQLEEMPLTPNGKVNTKALPEPQIEAEEYVAPETEAEQTVADIFSKVLSLDSNVGALDNFFSLGGDSIKAIRLISQLRAEGLNISVAEVMAGKTVRAIAAAARTETATAISQEPLIGEVRLNAIMKYFTGMRLPHASLYNQSNAFECAERLDTEIFKRALDAIMEHHDMLRATLKEDKFIVLPPKGTHYDFEEHDISGIDGITPVADRLQGSIDLENGPIFKAAVFHAPDKDYIMLICHHIAVDGVSWRVITEDLETAYKQLKEGKEVRLPEKTHSFKYYVDTEYEYRDSYALGLEKRHWEKVQKEMAELPQGVPSADPEKRRYLTMSFKSDAIKHLLTDAHRAYNTTENDLLITAYIRAYQRLTGEDSVSLLVEGHGREEMHKPLVIDRTVGWFTSQFPIVIKGINGDIRHDIRLVKETFREVPNKGLGYGILQYIPSGKGDKNLRTDLVERLCFNYLGVLSEDTDESMFILDSDINMGKEIDSTGTAAQAYMLDCSIIHDEFFAEVEYDSDIWDATKAEEMLKAFFEEIEKVVEHTTAVTTPELTASDIGAQGWTDGQYEKITADFAARGERIERVYPLTPMQEGMLSEYLLNPGTTSYVLLTRMRLGFLPSEDDVRYALDVIARKNEVLRTSIIYKDVEEPCQAIIDRKLGLLYIDISKEKDTDAAAERIHQEQLHKGFDLQDDPLVRAVVLKTSDSSCQMIFCEHHIITDGWSTPLYFPEFMSTVKEAAQGIRKPLPENVRKGGYEGYVHRLLKRDKNASMEYWRDLLADYSEKAVIPYSEGAEDRPLEGKNLEWEIEKGKMEKLQNLCTRCGVTVNSVVELAWGLVLQTYMRNRDAVFAKVVSGRTMEGTADIVGLFINTIPVRVKTTPEMTVKEALMSQQRQAAESSAHDYCSLAEVQQLSELKQNLFQSIVGFENYEGAETVDEGFNDGTGMELLQAEEENFNEMSVVAELSENGRLKIVYKYNAHLYSDKDMQTMADLMSAIIGGMAENADLQLRDIPLLSQEGQQEVMRLGTGEKMPYDYEDTFVSLFLEQAKENPQNNAVVDNDGAYTYQELDSLSNALAKEILGIIDTEKKAEKPFVCIMMGTQKEFLIAAIAVERAGMAYVPLDHDYPDDRLQYMLEDSESQLLITTHKVLNEKNFAKNITGNASDGTLNNSQFDTLFIDDFLANITQEDINVESINLATPDALAYMIYTSGSTGKPKGVMISNRAKVNLMYFLSKEWRLTPKSRVSCHASFSFDGSIMDLYPVLTVGGTLYVIPTEVRKDIDLLYKFIKDNKIDGGLYTTQLGQMLLQNYDLPLDFMAVGGEKMTIVPEFNGRLYNCYGPTEFTVVSTAFLTEQGREYSNIPIGRPLTNLKAFVLDNCGRLLPRGIPGELCMAGRQMARGYWHRDDLTEKVFCKAAFLNETSDDPYAEGYLNKVYHTGDLVRWNEDGQLEYLGRIDKQVKLRGFRIELGEIETLIAGYEGVDTVSVQVKEVGGVQHLVAYYSAKEEIDKEALRAYLAGRLTDYMVPTVYMQLDEMPLTPNGKVNTKALPEPEVDMNREIVKAANKTEQDFCDIFAKVLTFDEVGANESFFDLGGTSLSVTRVIFQAKSLGYEVSYQNIFDNPTPQKLAEKILKAKEEEAAVEIKEDKEITGYPYDTLQPILDSNTIDNFKSGIRQPIGNVLLTGATGFLGIHVFKELVDNYDGDIYCLLRGTERETALDRFKGLLFYYFEKDFAELIGKRVFVVEGDITQPIDKAVGEKVDTVINCAAIVKHFAADDSIFKVNTEGVEKLIDFCVENELKLIQVSTVSTIEDGIKGFTPDDAVCSENVLYCNQGEDNKYGRSKFLAERAVLDAIAHRHLRAKIMRVGNLSPRHSDGEFQINFNTNSAMGRIKISALLGCVPYGQLDEPMEFSPIDETAKAILLLAQAPDANVIFHPYNHQSFILANVIQQMVKCQLPIRFAEEEDYAKRLREVSQDPEKAKLLTSMIAYDEEGEQKLFIIPCENSLTMQVLYRMGYQWPATTYEYVSEFIEKLKGLGFFDF